MIVVDGRAGRLTLGAFSCACTIGKGGLVRGEAAYARVEARLREACAALGLAVRGWFESPIDGGDGNREFFIHAAHGAGEDPTP